jgi:hypothetical protein
MRAATNGGSSGAGVDPDQAEDGATAAGIGLGQSTVGAAKVLGGIGGASVVATGAIRMKRAIGDAAAADCGVPVEPKKPASGPTIPCASRRARASPALRAPNTAPIA